MSLLLARRRGLARALVALWHGLQNGDPTSIVIASVIGLGIVAIVVMKLRGRTDS